MKKEIAVLISKGRNQILLFYAVINELLKEVWNILLRHILMLFINITKKLNL
jgi:hypothetical protein